MDAASGSSASASFVLGIPAFNLKKIEVGYTMLSKPKKYIDTELAQYVFKPRRSKCIHFMVLAHCK